ncbi:hypothetical protein ACQ4N7_24305 [Nodosilinea sp. AN01ver1]|uniref:hypothetical protein n=1 Tax=Nodosilinea sp. AN01ver1 TaxID=3423362 RepID=UPI003D314210
MEAKFTPPAVPLEYRREVVSGASPIQNIYLAPVPWWQNRRYWAAGGIAVAALSGIAFAFAQSGRTGDEGTYQSELPAPNYENVLAAAQDRLSGNYEDSRLVLADVGRSVLNNEAYRYRQQAEQDVLKPTDPCYQQQIICPLNRYQRDAQVMLDAAKGDRDWRQAQAALFRVEAVEVARSMAALPQDPPTNLAVVAIENLVQYHDRQHSLSEEVQAHEVRD